MPGGGYQPKLPGMEPAPAEDLLGQLAQRFAMLADGQVSPLRRAGAGARQWRSPQPGRSGCDPEALRYAASTDPEVAGHVEDFRTDGATVVMTLTPLAVVAGIRLVTGLGTPSGTDASTPLRPLTSGRLTLEDPVFVIQLAYSRALRDSVGQRWEESDGIPDGALDDPGPAADLVVALLEAPRRLAADGVSREGATSALGAVAAAYLSWEATLPPRLPAPVDPTQPVLPARLLASATARVLERGMSGVGIQARERI